MSLIAHYPLNGDARDYFGNATTVNGSSGISYIDGKIGRAISFDNSSTGYLSAPEISTYLHGKPEASIALWVKKSAVQYGFLQLSGYSSSNGNLYPYQTTTKVYLDVFRTNRLGPIYMPTSVLEWHHLVITQKPGQWKLYQNGVLVNTSGADATVSTDYLQFELGRNSGSRYAYGDFDDVRIYDHALSEKEVSDLALGLSGSFKANTEIQSFSDATGTCNSQSLPAAVTAITEDGIPTFYFDGTNGLDTGKPYNFKQTDSFATFFEINIRDHSDRANAAAGVMGKGHYYSNSWSVYVRNNNALAFETTGNPARSGIHTLNTPALALNTWHKVCCVYRNGQKEIHLNGSIVGTGTYSGPGDLDNANTLKLGVRHNDSSRSLRGKLRNVKVFSTDLTQSAIDSLFQTGLAIDNIGNMHSKHLDQSPRVRYIRDYLNGSTSNSGSHWVEIQANDTDGVNVALNASAYDAAGNSEPLLTDGNTNTSPYVSGNTYMEVDLGSVFLLDNVHIWHYYGDGRTYYGTKTEVSVDGQNWITIFDNEVDGLYPETPSGKVHRVRSPSKFSVNYSGVSVGEASEVGISRGLVSWLPLIGDTKDRVTNEVATNNGAISVADGYVFDGVNDYIDLGSNKTFSTTAWTISFHINLGSLGSGAADHITGVKAKAGANWGVLSHFSVYNSKFAWWSSDEGWQYGNTTLSTGVLYSVALTYDGNSTVEFWLDGVSDGQTTVISANTNVVMAELMRRGHSQDRYTQGTLRGFKICDVMLTPEEIAQEYNSGKASLNKNSAFAKEFIEV